MDGLRTMRAAARRGRRDRVAAGRGRPAPPAAGAELTARARRAGRRARCRRARPGRPRGDAGLERPPPRRARAAPAPAPASASSRVDPDRHPDAIVRDRGRRRRADRLLRPLVHAARRGDRAAPRHGAMLRRADGPARTCRARRRSRTCSATRTASAMRAEGARRGRAGGRRRRAVRPCALGTWSSRPSRCHRRAGSDLVQAGLAHAGPARWCFPGPGSTAARSTS